MRILHVMASRANGGAETYAADMIESLHQHGHGLEQMAVCARPSINHDRLAAAGVLLASDVLDVPFRPWQRRKLSKAIADFKPELVHCWLRRAASLVSALDVPVIGWFGGFYDPAHFKHCTHFIGVTPGIVEHMIAHGVARERAHYVQTFPTLNDAPPVERTRHATPKDAPLLLTLSRLHEKKGLDTLLQALVGLPECVAWIAGDGPLEGHLKLLAEKLNIAHRVRFLGWRTDRAALLRAADICVLPSRWEPFGTVMLEAWAAGTPLVATASQGPRATITDGANGLLVPIDDPEALRQAIARLIADPPLKARLIDQGSRDYQSGFTRQAATLRMIEVYRQIIAEGRAASGTVSIAKEPPCAR
jgi:glycosyltransferase involved in cell wall biosynthesis